jgi:hypothetical protein
LRVNTAISFSELVKAVPEVLCRSEEGVLLVLNTELRLGMNPVGTQMWTALSGATSIQAAYDELIQTVPVTTESHTYA